MNTSYEQRRRRLVRLFAALTAVWVAVCCWLTVEHLRVRQQAREALLQRSRDISEAIALALRSGPPGLIREDRLNALLQELAGWEPLDTVILLNASSEIIAMAGNPAQVDQATLRVDTTLWEPHRVIVVNPVDFGIQTDGDGGPARTTIVVPTDQANLRRPAPPDSAEGMPPPRPPGPDPADEPRAERPDNARGDGPSRNERRRWSPFGRPPWMSEAEFEELRNRRGLHGVVLILSTAQLQSDLARDIHLRLLIAAIALVAVGGLGAAIHNWDKSARLTLRLLRSQQQNEHLKELNLAAAGLAHETRNPLNVVRGVAHMIRQDETLAEPVRERAGHIIEEIDVVTNRLNEFIKYSKPLEPRLAHCKLRDLAGQVRATLQTDWEDKGVSVAIEGEALEVEADETLLRQVLFNLLLNAIQFVPEGGRIVLGLHQHDRDTAALVVEDNGPGVPEELREEVLRPYFTTSADGSGLGLAVVRQICIAHGWTVRCDASPLGGARFTIAPLRITPAAEA